MAVGRLEEGIGEWMDEEFGHMSPPKKKVLVP